MADKYFFKKLKFTKIIKSVGKVENVNKFAVYNIIQKAVTIRNNTFCC